MLEFALVFPCFMLCALLIIDFGQVSAMRAVVDEAISRSMTRAISIANFDVNQTGPPQLDAGELRYRRMQVARTLASVEGIRFLESVGQFNTDPDNLQTDVSGARLHDIVYEDSSVANGPATMVSKLMVLRPGECAQVPSLGITECNRETLGQGPTASLPAQSPAFLMERHPVKVFAYASVDSYTPFLFKAPIKVQAFGYRQSIPEAPFSAEISEEYGLDEVWANVPPAPLPPFGRPVLPEEPEGDCGTQEMWAQAIQRSRDQGKPYVPRLVGGSCKPCPIEGACL